MDSLFDDVIVFIGCMMMIVVLTVALYAAVRKPAKSPPPIDPAYYMKCLGECAPYEPARSQTSFCVCNANRFVPDALPEKYYEPEH